MPFLPTRVGLGSDILRDNDRVRTVTSPVRRRRGARRRARAHLDAALVHMNRADAAGNGQYLGPDPYMDDLFLGAADAALPVAPSGSCRPRTSSQGGSAAVAADQPAAGRRRGRGARTAPTSPRACPTTTRDEAFQKQYAASAKSPEAWAEFRTAWLDLDEADYQAKRATERRSRRRAGATRGPTCACVADGRVLPRRRRDPGQPDRHDPDDRRPAGPRHLRARPGDDRRRGAAHRQRRGRSTADDAQGRRALQPVPARCSTGCGTAGAT